MLHLQHSSMATFHIVTPLESCMCSPNTRLDVGQRLLAQLSVRIVEHVLDICGHPLYPSLTLVKWCSSLDVFSEFLFGNIICFATNPKRMRYFQRPLPFNNQMHVNDINLGIEDLTLRNVRSSIQCDIFNTQYHVEVPFAISSLSPCRLIKSTL